MKRLFFASLFLSCAVLFFIGCRTSPRVEPLHPELWDEIEAYVTRSWPD